MKIGTALPCTLALLLLSGCANKKNVCSFEAMNTFMTIQSYGSKAEKANQKVQKEILELENKISTTLEKSDIYRINHNQSVYTEADYETCKLIAYAKNMAETTNGALNPALYPITSAWGFTTGNYRIPDENEIEKLLSYTDYSKILIENNKIRIDENMALDLGAVGKGYAGDKAIQILKENGVKSALLDLGGNIQTIGLKPDGKEWTIGIKNPDEENAIAGLKIHDKAVITSGGYERFFSVDDKKYIHIFDGKTGLPVDNDVKSVTIICDQGIYGDSLSTALFVMGSDKAKHFYEINNDFDFLMITNANKLIYTEALADKLILMHEFDEIEILKKN